MSGEMVHHQENETIKEEDAYLLVYDYLNFALKKRGIIWPDCPDLPAEPTPAMKAMRIVGSKFESEYLQQFGEMSTEFGICSATSVVDFTDYSNALFMNSVGSREMQINWGRIVSLFAWGGFLAARCYKTEKSYLVANLAQWIAIFVETKLQCWIDSHGGWNGLIKFSERKTQKNEAPIWPYLGAAGIIGLGAVAIGTIIHVGSN